jgi:hypothetical protein
MSDDAPVQLSDQDVLDIVQLQSEPDGLEPEPQAFRPILHIWHEVLKPAASEADAKVTPQWATRICAEYSQLRFDMMNEFRDIYFGKLAELNVILEDEIASDDECLTYTESEDDAKFNAHHYKNLLLQWQLSFLEWEMDWDCTTPYAAIELAAISEAHKMFFGQVGITAFLDNIGFEYTEDDSQLLATALEEFRGERS